MATARKWSNVAVAMQSAIAGAKTISAISKANPGVITSSTHGYSDGDYVYLSINGMYQLNNRVFKVASSAANSFAIADDTTSYDTFTSGSAYKLTLGTSITTATSISASGGDFDFIDTTTIHVNQRSQIPGLTNPATYTMDNIWDVSDAGLVALKAAYDAQAIRAFKFTFGTGGPKMVFAGTVAATLLPTGTAQDKITTPTTILVKGSPT